VTRVARASRSRSAIPVFSGSDLSGRSLPLLELKSARPGPLLWLTAAVHGDEVTGIEVIHRLFDALPGMEWHGRIKAIPCVNPSAFGMNQRHVPAGHEDMNRIFPGDPTGSPAARTAHAVFTAIRRDRPTAHIDLHTDSTLSVPYVILDRALSAKAKRPLGDRERMARAGGQEPLFDWPTEDYRKLHLDRSLSGAVLNQAHVPSFTMELGPTRVAQSHFVESGYNAVLAAMHVLDMLPARLVPRLSTARRPPRFRLPGLTANHVGLLRFEVDPGADVQAGATIARVVDLVGAPLERIVAPLPGRVVSLTERVCVYPGMTVATLSVLESLRRRARG
jgi:uncharacterized protein